MQRYSALHTIFSSSPSGRHCLPIIGLQSEAVSNLSESSVLAGLGLLKYSIALAKELNTIAIHLGF